MRWLFYFLIPLALHAENSTISSKKATYDGNDLILKGKVQMEHALGTIQAENARLIRSTQEGPASSLHLDDAVSITLKNQEKIECAKADFDFTALKGTLFPKLNGLIHFSNLYAGLMSLASKSANVELTKLADSLKVTKIHTHDGVEIQYDKDFVLKADSATFSNEKSPHLSASPHCLLTHEKDRVEAEKIEMYPETSRIIASAPKGTLNSTSLSGTDETQFSCRKLIWENAPHILTLQGNVHVADPCMGDLVCEEEVELCQKEEQGKWILSEITAKGKTTIEYGNSEELKQKLISYGQMHLDNDRLVLTLESPPDLPLEYFYDHMKLTADHAKLSYIKKEEKITPHSLDLNRNIHLYKLENNLRCALADACTFYPEEQKMILSAKEGGNVLFWDDAKQLSMSAKQIHIEKGEKGENIKGVGNVRFVFSSSENELLKKLFPFYKPKKGPND